MRAGCSASTFISVAAWEQSLHPGSPGHRLAHRKGPLNAENAVRTSGLPLTAGRNPGGLNGYRLSTVATQIIPATVNEAPYILDELLMTRGRAEHPRAMRRLRRCHRPCLRRPIPARLSVHPAHPGPAVETAARLRARSVFRNPDRIDRQQNPGGRDRAGLAGHPAGCCHPGQWCPSAEPDAAKVRSLSAPARTGRRSPRNRAGRTNALHRGLAARRRYAVPGQHRPEQGRGSSRTQERAPDRTPGPKSATARARASTTEWPGSTCLPPSSSTGIPPVSAKRSDSGKTSA